MAARTTPSHPTTCTEGADEVRLRLDRDLCVGHAQCYTTDPDLFPIDDEGFSLVDDQVVADDRITAARAGVNACPERALRLEDEA